MLNYVQRIQNNKNYFYEMYYIIPLMTTLTISFKRRFYLERIFRKLFIEGVFYRTWWIYLTSYLPFSNECRFNIYCIIGTVVYLGYKIIIPKVVFLVYLYSKSDTQMLMLSIYFTQLPKINLDYAWSIRVQCIQRSICHKVLMIVLNKVCILK